MRRWHDHPAVMLLRGQAEIDGKGLVLDTLSIVLPCHNEQGNIGPLINEIAAVFTERGLDVPEIVVVDDASSDASLSEVRRTRQDVPTVKLLKHKQRSGKSAAVWTGMQAADGNWAAIMDGDGQNDPADLAKWWADIIADPPASTLHLINGKRRKRNDGFIKFLTSRSGNFIRRWLLKDRATDTGSGLKLFRREAFLRFPYFDNMHRYYAALAIRGGGEMQERPINDRPRKHGTSKYGFFDRLAVGILDVYGVFWLMRRGSFPEVEAD